MKFQSNSIFNGTITANSVADAGTNTDKFLVLNSGGVVTYRTAAELYADLGVGASSAAYTSVLKHPVKAGEAINKGQAVYVSSANGTNMIVTKASNAAESTSSKTIGLLETTLANNGIGNVVTEGLLAGLDTTGATNAGDPVWLGTSGNLIYGLANKPYAPAHLVFIGIVTRINASNGEIFVKVQNGFELREIHDVDLITTTPVNGHILGYDGTLWVNKTIASWLGFTPVTNARTLTINGTGYDLSADRSWTINSMVYPSAGIAVSTGTAWGTSITDNSTNWNTAYTNRITSLTVTGSSGAATLVSNTLNIPTYTLAGLGGVPTSRSLTINGTAYDLSADRSWTIDSTSASTRTIQKFTATSGQTTFTITGGYAVGMVDVYMNGVKLDNATDFTASNGTTVVLAAGALTNSVIEVYKFGSQFIPNNALRVVTSFTATAAQTTFTVNYSVGLIDVFYNGSNLAQSEYTATNGTSIILATACQLNDIVVVYAYSYSVGAYSGIGGSGTSGYISKFTGTNTIGNSIITDNGTTASVIGLLNVGNAATASASININSDASTASYLYFNGAAITNNYTYIIGNAGATSNLRFYTANTLALTLASSGAATFASSVTINSLLYLKNGAGASGGIQQAYFASSVDSRSWWLSNDVNQYGDFCIQSSTTQTGTTYATRLSILNNGNVGIGTSSPSRLLTVYNSANGTSAGFGGTTYGVRIDNGGTFSSGRSTIYGVDATFYGSYQPLSIESSVLSLQAATGANVLIGTTTDNGVKLQVYNGAIQVRDSGYDTVYIGLNAATIQLNSGNSSDSPAASANLRIGDVVAGRFWLIQQGSAKDLRLQNYNGGWADRGSFQPNTGVYTALSDINKKKDFELSTIGLNSILNLKPTLYRMKTDDDSTDKHLGFIAQEVKEFIPQAYTETGNFIGLDYNSIVAALVKAVQELTERLIKLESK